MEQQSLTRAEFTEALFGVRDRYWDGHPFHVRLHSGGATVGDIRAWVANRCYYQNRLARKNAAIIANCPLAEVRRAWLHRVGFYDGDHDADGGQADWLALAEAVGLDPTEVYHETHVLRGVRFAVDAYLHFCQTRPWTEAVAAALTELFSPQHMSDRMHAWRRHYDWIKPDGMTYFEKRIPAAQSDSAFTLDVVLSHCLTRAEQDAAVAALRFKCDVLGAMLDAIDYAGRP